MFMARSVLDRLPCSGDRVWIMCLSWAYALERAKVERAKVSERAKGAGEGNRTLMTSLEGRWCRNRPTRDNVPAGRPGMNARE